MTPDPKERCSSSTGKLIIFCIDIAIEKLCSLCVLGLLVLLGLIFVFMWN